MGIVTVLLKLIGGFVLVVAVVLGVGLWDLMANGGRIFYRLAGRDFLLQDCAPPLRANLIGKGFSPVDITFDEGPSIRFSASSFQRTRTLASAFSFSDGQDGPRVDGRLVCTVAGPTVQVEVDVDELPHRVT